MGKKSQFAWKQYLEENRPYIYKHIGNFRCWCINNRPKKSIFDTEQELLQAISLYDNRENKNSKFGWQQYLKENRSDIFKNIKRFKAWCVNHRPKQQLFDTEQELLQAISLYDNRQIRIESEFNWKQYLEYNRPDIFKNINRFKNWCNKYRPKKQIFNTEQELLETLQLYDKRANRNSQFEWQQYLKQNRPDINIDGFKTWCNYNRPKKQIFDIEQELLEAISFYSLCDKYILRKTKYQDIYNLTEKETGLKFNFYKLRDMLGLIQ